MSQHLESLLERQQANTVPDDILHYFCDCDETKAVCGLAVDPDYIVTETPPGSIMCVVCVVLIAKPCQRCGGQ